MTQRFVSNDLSSFYFEVCKDRLYTSGKDWNERRSAQTALHSSLGALLAVCGPLVPFTAEDIYQFYAVSLDDLRRKRSSLEAKERLTENKVFPKDVVPGTSLFRILSWQKSGDSSKSREDNPSEDVWSILDFCQSSDSVNHEIEASWIPVASLRENVQRVIEVARKEKKAVGSSLEAGIELVGD